MRSSLPGFALALILLMPLGRSVRAADVNFESDIEYANPDNQHLQLDMARPAEGDGPFPAVVCIHGGGFRAGKRESWDNMCKELAGHGFVAVTVTYRLAPQFQFPAAVEDCQCALRFIADHAKDYNIDVNRIVVMGESAGGHLALTTGMIPASAGFERQCPGGGFTGGGAHDLPKVAAILDWYGISDLNDMLSGPNQRGYAVAWFAGLPNAQELAKKVSPLTYVRRDLPPILIIHGDADPIVPYSQATRLRDALTAAGAPNDMYTVPGGSHGNYPPDQRVKIYEKIQQFLAKYNVM